MLKKRALKFKKPMFQPGGTIGGSQQQVTISPQIQLNPSVFSTFKMYETAQMPTIDRAKLKPQLDLDKLKGHRNEVGAIYQKKEALDKALAGLTDSQILSNSEQFQTIMSQYNNLLSPKIINELAVSKEYSERAYQSAEKKGTMGEMNVRNGKFMMKAGDGKVSEVPLDKIDAYIQNGYRLMTTGELFHERDTNPNLAFGYDFDQRLSYGVGGEELRKRFAEQLKVGSTEQGSKGEGFQLLNQKIAEGIEDVFEVSSGGGKRIKDNYKQLDAAVRAIQQSMTQEERDSLMGIITARLINNGSPINSDTITAEALSYFGNLRASKEEYSRNEESFSRLGSRITGSPTGGGKPPEVAIGPAEAQMMGFGNPINHTYQVGSSKVDVRGTLLQIPGESYITGSGDNVRPKGLMETDKFKLMGNTERIQTLSGKKVKPSDVVLTGEEQFITFAYVDPATGQYQINSDKAKKARQDFENAFEQFKQQNPGATRQQVEQFHQRATAALKSQYGVEQVVSFGAYIPLKDQYRDKTIISDTYEYDKLPGVSKALEANNAGQGVEDRGWWSESWGDDIGKTSLLMPATPQQAVRMMVDKEKVTTPDAGVQDFSQGIIRSQQGIQSGNNFTGSGISTFNFNK